ncbi:MAG TPA: hypothetical protein VLM89_15195 [Phycisphaerae bacterium]|nr:hypothetical protein [Phycisphaerae bacterium]
MIDEHIERLISRRLDGETTEAESLELDKELIRLPKARAYLEEQERLGDLAGSALRAAVARDHEQPWLQPNPRDLQAARRRLLRPAVGLAAAVALAALIGTLPPGRTKPVEPIPPVVMNDSPAADSSKAPVPAVPVAEGAWSPGAGRHEVIGVFDEDTQSFYLLEMAPKSEVVSPAAMRY